MTTFGYFPESNERIYFDSQFKDKDAIKKLGCYWSIKHKLWCSCNFKMTEKLMSSNIDVKFIKAIYDDGYKLYINKGDIDNCTFTLIGDELIYFYSKRNNKYIRDNYKWNVNEQ